MIATVNSNFAVPCIWGICCNLLFPLKIGKKMRIEENDIIQLLTDICEHKAALLVWSNQRADSSHMVDQFVEKK